MLRDAEDCERGGWISGVSVRSGEGGRDGKRRRERAGGGGRSLVSAALKGAAVQLAAFCSLGDCVSMGAPRCKVGRLASPLGAEATRF